MISEIVLAGFGFLHISCKEGYRGGGVAIIYIPEFNLTINKTKGAYTYLENIDCSMSIGKMT